MTFCAYELKNNVPVAIERESEQYEWPFKWDKDVVTFDVVIPTEDVNVQDNLRKAVGLAFTTWASVIPLKFARVTRTATADIKISFQNDPDADTYLKEHPTVLAYAYYPKTSKQGIIVFNDYSYDWGTRDQYIKHKHIWNVIHVLIHEIGHSLGLSHDESDGVDVLDPYYNGTVTELSNDDISRIQEKYGKREFRFGTFYTRMTAYLFYALKRLNLKKLRS